MPYGRHRFPDIGCQEAVSGTSLGSGKFQPTECPMLPALFLLIITLPAMAALELRADTFAVLLLIVCVVAGLTAPAGGGHATVNRRRPAGEPSSKPAGENDDEPFDKSTTRIAQAALAK